MEKDIYLIGAAGGVGTTTLAVAMAIALEGTATASSLWPEDARNELSSVAGLPDGEQVTFGDGPTIHDSGSLPGKPVGPFASKTYLVVRGPDYRCLKRALKISPTERGKLAGMIVLTEPGRALDVSDAAEVLGIANVIEVPLDAAVARACDAGLLASRMPRSLESVITRTFGAKVAA